MLGLAIIFLVAFIMKVDCTFNDKEIINIGEKIPFCITNLDWKAKNQTEGEQNIFQFQANTESDYLLLNVANLTDFTQNPVIIVTQSLQELRQVTSQSDNNSTSKKINYIKCSLSYTQSCIISNLSSKVRPGQTFYLIFKRPGVNYRPIARILPQNFTTTDNTSVMDLQASQNSGIALFNAHDIKQVNIKLPQISIKNLKSDDDLCQIEVFFLNLDGSLFGNKSKPNELEDLKNDVSITLNKEPISQDSILFQSSILQNRQFVIEFDLKKLQKINTEQSNDELRIQVLNNISNKQWIVVAYKYQIVSQTVRNIILTTPLISNLNNKINQSQLLIKFQNPFLEHLVNQQQDGKNLHYLNKEKIDNSSLLFSLSSLLPENQNISDNIKSKVYVSKQQLELDQPQAIYNGLGMFILETKYIQKAFDQIKDSQGIYLRVQIQDQQNIQNNLIQINTRVLIDTDQNQDNSDDYGDDNNTQNNSNNNSNNNNNDNQNNNNNKNDNNNNNHNTNTNTNNGTNNNSNNNNNDKINKDSNSKGDQTFLIIIVVIGIAFIIISTLIYVKCQNRQLEDPEQLDEVGEEGEKQNDNPDDLEKGHSSGDHSGNTIKKPQSTKNSIKTNGNHIQLAQEDDKSGLYELEQNHLSDRKQNVNNGDLSANNLNNDKKQLLSKKPSQRKKNKRDDLFIDIVEQDNAKEQQQFIKLQQLKFLQQKAQQQKQQQQQIAQQK
ncbi:hypothetical protein ABPG74_022861 [Tetrahymena malaccensis]